MLPVKVLIAGNKDKVQEAKDIITELTTYYHSDVTHPGQVHVEMDVNPSMYNNIIGSKVGINPFSSTFISGFQIRPCLLMW